MLQNRSMWTYITEKLIYQGLKWKIIPKFMNYNIHVPDRKCIPIIFFFYLGPHKNLVNKANL